MVMQNEKYGRRKAFIGTAIAAVGSIAGGLIKGAAAKKKAKEEALRTKRDKAYNAEVSAANALNAGLDNQTQLQDEFIDEYTMRLGGSKCRKRKAIGGLGDIIGGVIGAAGSVTEAVTGVEGLGAAGNAIGSGVGGAITKRNKDILNKRKADRLATPLATPNNLTATMDFRKQLPTQLPLRRYGGKSK